MGRGDDDFGGGFSSTWRFVLLLAIGIGFSFLYAEFSLGKKIDDELRRFHEENTRIEREHKEEVQKLELRIRELESNKPDSRDESSNGD